jgi:hypothetical protein
MGLIERAYRQPRNVAVAIAILKLREGAPLPPASQTRRSHRNDWHVVDRCRVSWIVRGAPLEIPRIRSGEPPFARSIQHVEIGNG